MHVIISLVTILVFVASCKPRQSELASSQDQINIEVFKSIMEIKAVHLATPGEFWIRYMSANIEGQDPQDLASIFELQNHWEKTIKYGFDDTIPAVLALEALTAVWEILHEGNLPETTCIRLHHEAASALGVDSTECKPAYNSFQVQGPSNLPSRARLRAPLLRRIDALVDRSCDSYLGCIYAIVRCSCWLWVISPLRSPFNFKR
jgi:hypothetical protein